MLNNYVKNDSFWMTSVQRIAQGRTNDAGESSMRATEMIKVRLECFKLIVRFTHDCYALLV